jgi:rubrerythrin
MARFERKEKYAKPTDERELLLLAVEREEASRDFYETMARHFYRNEGIRTVLEDLKNAESGHLKTLQEKLKELDR